MNKRIITVVLILTFIVAATFFVSCDKFSKEPQAPQNIVYDGIKISWNAAPEADYYTVQINDGEVKRVNSRSFSFNANEEQFNVVVSTVLGDKSASNSLTFTPLETITQFDIEEDGNIKWDEVQGATGYRIMLNGKVLPTDIYEAEYKLSEGTIRVKVRPIVSGDETYYSNWSKELKLQINATPTSLKYDGETISWSGTAAKYEVNINGDIQEVYQNSIPYASNNNDFSVSVKAKGDGSYSFDSQTISEDFYYLASVRDIKIENGKLVWEPVDNANGYKIKINGIEQPELVTKAEYDQIAVGTHYSIEIKPSINKGKYFSVWSEPKNVYLLQTPIVKWNNDLELDGEANNNFIWDIVNGAAGYHVSVEKDGKETTFNYDKNTTAFAYAYLEVGVYKVKVQAVAEPNSDNYTSKYSETITVERLPAPKANGSSYITSDPSNLSKGFTVNYMSVSGASGYQLYKDGVKLDGKFTNVLSITDTSVYNDNLSDKQTYTYKVRSIGGVKTVGGKTYVTLSCLSEQALSFNIIVQAMPQAFKFEGTMAKWENVSGSNGYSVKYSGSISSAVNNNFDFSILKAGTYDVSVCAKGNGGSTLASNYTAPMTVKRMQYPTNIRIDYNSGEGQLVCDEIKDDDGNVLSYQIFLDQSVEPLPENAKDHIYQYITEQGSVIHMVTVANCYSSDNRVYYMSSEASPTQQFIRLARPTFPDGKLSNSNELVWNVPANINTAEYTPTYRVFVDETDKYGVVNGTRCDVTYLEGGKSYKFKVRAVGNGVKYLDSETSIEISVYKLATPLIRIENNAYVWDGVLNESSYVLEIDGRRVSNEIEVLGSKYSYTPRFTEKGVHTVKLRAIGDGGYETIDSNPFEITQKVEVLLSPEFTFKYSDENYVTGGSIQVYITKSSANNNGYIYEIAGTTEESKQETYSRVINSTGTYSVKVKAKGGAFDGEGVYYMDSPYGLCNIPNGQIVILAPPTAATFSITAEGVVRWASVNGNLGYDYMISYDGGDYSEVLHTTSNTTPQIPNFKQYKTISIKVRTSGNGSSSVSSQWIEFVWNNPNM